MTLTTNTIDTPGLAYRTKYKFEKISISLMNESVIKLTLKYENDCAIGETAGSISADPDSEIWFLKTLKAKYNKGFIVLEAFSIFFSNNQKSDLQHFL